MVKACGVTEILWCGFEAYALDNSLIRAVIVPSLGGKIVSLVDLRTQHDWLWKNPDTEPVAPVPASAYIRHLGGWDECFPSISETLFPCGSWAGIKIPDHGEIWSLPWHASTFVAREYVEIRTTIHGQLLPYRFERVIRIRAGEPEMSLRYLVENLSDEPMPFIWSSHPTLNASPGDKLVIPQQEMIVYNSLSDRFGPRDARLSWPTAKDTGGQLWDLSVLPEAEPPTSLKLFTRKHAADSAILEDTASCSQLRFNFNSNEITHLGIWLNFKAWSVIEGGPKYYCIAIEPCIGGSDDLSLSYHNDDCAVIPSQGHRIWNLSVRLERPSKETF